MTFDLDETLRTVSFEVPEKIYSRQGLDIAAQVFSSRADVFLSKTRGLFELTLKAKRKDVTGAQLEALAGEFLNELLNQEYRFIVGRFNRKISNLIVTQTLLSARGAAASTEAPEEEKTPEFKAAVAAMLKAAAAEIRATMPMKIPDQGSPLPPAAEGSVG